MTLARPWLQIFLAGCVWTQVASAQTGTGFGGFGSGTTGSGGTTGGTTGGSGTNQSGTSSANRAATDGRSGTEEGTQGTTTGGTGTPAPPPPTTPPGGTQPPSDPFGFGTPITPTSPFGPLRAPGATTTFGLEPRNAAPAAPAEPTDATGTGTGGAATPAEEGPSYTAPNFYGAPQQVLTPGSGRFARPRYRYSVSMGIGFDDNTQQTTEREDIPDQVFRQVIPAEPEIATFVTERQFVGLRPAAPGSGAFRPIYRNVQRKVVLRPAQPEQVIETPIPGIDFPDRNSSIVSRLDGQVDVQWAKARELFTMDLRAGAEYYWNRDLDPLEFNGSLAATYLRRITSRMQFTGNASLSYQSQPDYSQINVVDSPDSTGSYFVGNVKLDLTYRWAARFSTVTSVTGGSIMYQGQREAGNYYELGLGNEFRYTQSRRTTWVLETRYSQLKYLEAMIGAVDTFFLLVGSDWMVSRRLRTTVRLGEAIRTFEDGGSSSSPYAEIGAYWQPSRREQLSFTGRYGFEQTTNAQDESVVGRFSAAYTRTFTPRFLGSLSGNYVRSAVTSGNIESTSEIIDASLLFRYMFSRRFSMNARYSYTLSKTSSGFNDYDRNRFFVTGEYEF